MKNFKLSILTLGLVTFTNAFAGLTPPKECFLTTVKGSQIVLTNEIEEAVTTPIGHTYANLKAHSFDERYFATARISLIYKRAGYALSIWTAIEDYTTGAELYKNEVIAEGEDLDTFFNQLSVDADGQKFFVMPFATKIGDKDLKVKFGCTF
jgi:hypothetical protein